VYDDEDGDDDDDDDVSSCIKETKLVRTPPETHPPKKIHVLRLSYDTKRNKDLITVLLEILVFPF
jgi:hypothetical protein